jgi:phosphoserine aminotransferase
MNIPAEILPNVTFACGPSQGHPQIRKAALSDTLFERSHRNAKIAAEGLFKEATGNIKKLLSVPDDYALIFYHGGATSAMDAVAWNLIKDDVSGLSFGAFSKLWTKNIVNAVSGEIKKDFKSPAKGEYFPKELPDFNASLVMLTPNETSMGVQIPNEYLEKVWSGKGKDALIAWDCTSCAGGRTLPVGKYDIMLFSLQKCFGCGGATSVVILSPRAIARAEEVSALRQIPYILQFAPALDKAKKFQMLNTPSNTNIWMANEAARWMLSNGGLTAMDALCRKHSQTVLDFAATTDYLEPLIASEANRSYTTLTLRVSDPALKDSDINSAVKSCGKANLVDGIGKYSSVEDNSLRVACFPFVDINGRAEFELLCKTIDYIVKELRGK